MKILSWNIQQPGEARLSKVLGALARHDADTVVLCEVSKTQLPTLRRELTSMRYRVTEPELRGRQTGVLFASRSHFETRSPSGGKSVLQRLWREVYFPDRAFSLAGLYLPDKPEGISKFWPLIHRAAQLHRDEAFLFVGDFNSGTAAFDAQYGALTGDPWFSAMLLNGFTDLWRHKHRSKLEYTWYSRAKNGFRLDHAFASNKMRPRVRLCEYSHGERKARVSDHSLLLLKVW